MLEAPGSLRLSVTEICLAFAGLSRGFGGRGGLRARWLGRALHARYQDEARRADPSFAAEVPVRMRLLHRRRVVEIFGRADGVRRGADGVLRVEELKSGTHQGLAPRRLAAHHLQAALYAWMLAATRREAVVAELVWLDGHARAVLREPTRFGDAAREEALQAALAAISAEAEAQAARRARARATAGAVRFPHPTPRPGQVRLSRSVARALEQGEHLLVEAETGSGKTAAALTPALRHAMASGRRLFFLTASALQQHLAMETLRRLAPSEEIALAVRIRARERMCATQHLRCHETTCPYASDYARRLAPLLATFPSPSDPPVLEPERIRARGESLQLCPFELSLDLARRATVTVCDVNYAIDPGVALHELRNARTLRDAILVVDEVHALPDRARAGLGAELDGQRAAAAVEAAALGGSPLHRRQRELLEALLQLLDQLAREAEPSGGDPREWLVEHEPPVEALEELGAAFDEATQETLDACGEAPAPSSPNPFLETAFSLHRLRRTFAEDLPGFASLVGRRAGMPRLERFCRDPAPSLRPLLTGCHAFVGLSGTLPAPEVLADVLGLDPERRALLRLPGPFGEHQRRLVIDPHLDTRWRTRSRDARPIAAALSALARAVPAGCLAVLPSHAAVAQMRALLYGSELPVICQGPEDDESRRRRLVEEVCAGGPCLLLAVAGGALAEGVDYPSGGLAAVAVVGPCPPAPNPRQALLEELYEERFGRGFDLAYALPGMVRVMQSAGRLVRSEADRGVIALLGRRFLRAPYRDLIPESWLAGRAPEDWVGDPAAVARAFFAGGGCGFATAT